MARVANKRVLPGFGLSLGFTLTYLSLIVLIPLSAVFLKAATMAPQEFWNAVTSPRVVASYKLTFGAALLAAAINAFFGLLLAWGLTRYTFPGRKIVDALIDLPFALPTAVAGIALTAIYARNGWMGSLLEPLGIKIAFTPAGVLVALADNLVTRGEWNQRFQGATHGDGRAIVNVGGDRIAHGTKLVHRNSVPLRQYDFKRFA